MSKTVAEEYIIKITPELDRKQFEAARKSVSELFKSDKSGMQANNNLKQMASVMKNVDNGGKSFLNSIGQISGKVAIATASIKVVYDLMQSIVKSATEFSNKMISASSAFVDKDTRQLMATFGVSGQTATGLGSVMETMGLSTSNLKTMTPGQMNLFSNLMQQWEDGMNSIDPQSLAQFQEVMQGFQSSMASTQIRFQIELNRLLVSIAPQLQDFFDAIISFLNMLIDLLNNPIIKTALKIIIEVVAWIIKIITALSQVLTGDFVGALETITSDTSDFAPTSYSTTNLTINANSTNTFNGDTNSMYGLATETQQTNSNMIMSTYNRNGKA